VTPVSFSARYSSSGGEQAATSAKADLDYNSFLMLLIASMKNQDPTKPNDPSETLSQLASFSNVEQGIKLNDKLDRLLATSGVGEAIALIGKTVSTLNGSISGVAKSVELSNGGAVVILESGVRLRIEDGIRVTSV
jgi:flagellar basal-body rod modification protein FlgD